MQYKDASESEIHPTLSGFDEVDRENVFRKFDLLAWFVALGEITTFWK